jgi:hypothetical protein
VSLDTARFENEVKLAAPLLEGDAGGSGPSQVREGTVQYMQRLVEYFYKRRSEYEPFWRAVEKAYQKPRGDQRAINPFGSRSKFMADPGRVTSYATTTQSLALARKPRFKVESISGAAYETAMVAQKWLNKGWNLGRGLHRQTGWTVIDAYLYGQGWQMTTWDTSSAKAERLTQQALKRREAEAIAAEEGVQLPDFDVERALVEAAKAPMDRTFGDEMDDAAMREAPATRHVPIAQMIFDPDARSIDNVLWVGRAVVLPMPAWKAMKGIAASAIVGAEADELEKTGYRAGAHDTTAPYALGVAYEIYYREDGGFTRYTFAMGSDRWVKPPEASPYWYPHPYEQLTWTDTGASIWPQSGLNPVWETLIEERVIRSKFMEAMFRGLVSKHLYDNNFSLSDASLRALKDPNVSALVGVDVQPGEDIQRRFAELKSTPFWPEIQQYLAVVYRDQEMGSGFGVNTLGQYGKSGTSATEADQVGQFVRARATPIYNATEAFVGSVAKKRLALLAQFRTPAVPENLEWIARHLGPESVKAWASRTLTPGDVDEDIDVSVQLGSMRPTSEDADLQRALMILQLLAGDPVQQILVDMPLLWKEIFDRSGYDADHPLVRNVSAEAYQEAQMQFALLGQLGGGAGSGSKPRQNAPPASGTRARQANAGAVNGGSPR